VDSSTLVAITLRCVLDYLDCGQLSWFLVVFDLWTDLQVQLPAESIVKVGKELGLEDAAYERIRLLATHNEREPVVLET
jgi:hypothetical protein